ncbi:MAG: bifunctional phosphoglucose/phosphomannose isomerase [Candidatus Marinimicrobia bacterium]|nr:bifunctional phosphoglucose/phosphomannose isomerase [Candidatus Neomarinimicrobiota bacterium]
MYKSQIDPQDMFGAIYRFADQIQEAIGIGEQINLKNNYSACNNIIVAGMGGSAIGGDVVKTLIHQELKIPFYVNRNYSLPNWVNEKTLVICSSYSGNTEESLSAYEDALKKGAMICGISTGGQLSEIIQAKGFDLITIQGGLQPRAALAYSFVPMLYLLNKIGHISNSLIDDLSSSIIYLENKRDTYSIGDSSNPTYKMAKDIYGMIPIIYGATDTTGVVALRWKGQLCENSKMLAYHNEIPELNHNEIVGWGNNPDLLSELSVIWLRDKNDNMRVRARQDITKTILDDIDIMQNEVNAEGANNLERLLDLINYGDWLSYWCAILHNTDPSPVEKINKLKKALEEID